MVFRGEGGGRGWMIMMGRSHGFRGGQRGNQSSPTEYKGGL